jgi:translocation and assembly module TamB
MGIFKIQNKLMRRLFKLAIVVFFVALVFFLLRGPYLSNSIKRVIIPVLEDATGEKIIIDKAVINLFPFYLQTKGFKIFDEEGNKLLRVTKMRAYIDVPSLFSKKIRIKRLTVKEPELTTDSKTLEKIGKSIEEYTKKEGGGHFSVSLKNIRMTDGEFTLTDAEKKLSAAGQGLYMEIIVKDAINIDLSLKNVTMKLPDLPELKAGLDGDVEIRGKKIKISEVKVYSSDSTIEARGNIQQSSTGTVESGSLSGTAKIFANTISEIFDLKERKDGVLSVSGSVDLMPVEEQQNAEEAPKIKLDLEAHGWFYLETLMELLEVNENIKGRVSIDGKITGVYPEVSGTGTARLEDAVLGGLPLDDLKGELKYENNKFSLKDFVANTYEGEIRGNAYIIVPGGKYFVAADVADIDSPQFFKFINWEPPFPAGKINGNFELNKTPGREIEITAQATYLNTSKNIKNLIHERLHDISTEINLAGGVLNFNKTVFSTSASKLFMDGVINLNTEKLNLNLYAESNDTVDLTAPYFSGLRAPARFTGKAEGFSEKPEISGAIEIGPGTVNGVQFAKVAGDLSYNPGALSVKSMWIENAGAIYDVSGSIDFRKSTGLFSFADPYFKGKAVIKNGDAKSLISAAFREIPLSGVVNGEISFDGDTKEFKGAGNIVVEDGAVFGQSIDRALVKAVFSQENIKFTSVDIYKDKTRLEAKGLLYFDGRFDVWASSSNLNLRDITILKKYPFEANLSLDIKGSGTFKDPDIKFSLNIVKAYFKDALIGKGKVAGELKGKRVQVKGDFLNGVVTADAEAFLSDTLPWEAGIRFKNGRYDFILAGFLKNVPRDLSASLQGEASFKGTRDTFSMNSRFSTLSFSLYGYNFRNRGDIVLNSADGEFKIEAFSIGGKNADINAVGVIKAGRDYNFVIDGNIDLAPLKVMSKDIESLRGHGNFVIGVSGPWGKPGLKGEINIRDATVMLAGLPHSIGPVNGDIFLDKDRVTFDSFKTDFAGGKIIVSGFGELDRFSLKRLSISSKMEDIKFRPLEDVSVFFDGQLFYESLPEKQSLLGEILIKKAGYEKRVDWKSWLLSLKEIKEARSDQPSFLDTTGLNIHIKGEENIFINNNIAKTPVKIDVTVQGTFAQYGLIGSIEAKDGIIFFRGNEFKIIDGSVDFIEPNRVVPVFHIQAETFISGYRIKLDLDGPSDKFVLSFFSNPPLTEMEIFTLLTSGQINKESKGLEGGLGAGEATAFLTGRLQDVMEERVKYITGFERFEINPHTTAAGSVSPGITVGKRLMGEKLVVTYSTSVGSTGEHVVKLQYNLSNNFSLIGIRDERGSTGGDFKYRFEFK